MNVCSPLVALLPLAGVALLLPPGVSAQEVELTVGEDVLVGQETDGTTLIEPHLAAHPTDPRLLLGVGWVFPEGENDDGANAAQHCATFSSRDAGRTWRRRDLEAVSCADPWVSLGDRGAVLTALGTHPSLPAPGRRLLVYFSPDSGRSWHDVPQDLGVNHDGPRSIAGPDGTVYVVSGQAWSDEADRLRFTVLVGRARRGRPHVETMGRLLPSNLNLNSDGLAVLSDGALVVSYDDFGRSVDGAWTRAGALERRRSWAVISDDGGRTFSIPFFITESCYDRPTSLAADTSSGPYRDRLYHACAGADYRSILVTRSVDRTDEWSLATPIEAPASQEGSRREPQIAVNSRGIVAVAWMDRRDDPSGDCYAPYVAASADGGETFSAPVRVADELSCPDLDRLGFPGRRWPTGGDYFGLAPAADGRFHLLWPDARDGSYQLRTAAVSVDVLP